jgi:heat shock protein HslJ
MHHPPRLLLALAVVLAACGAPGATPSSSPAGPADVEGSWELVAGRTADGALPLVQDHPITLTIEGTRMGGTAACNGYGGRFMMRDGRLVIDDFAMTAMGCEEPIARAEAAYVAALEEVTALTRDGESLVLSGPTVELRFAPLPEPPTAQLVDTVWVLETLFGGDVASPAEGDPAMLELRSDGTMTGSTGCRGFDGRWQESGELIIAPTMGMTDQVCPAELAAQDSHVVSVVGDGFVPTVEEDLLTLTDPGGIGLVYRAER